MNKPKIVRVEEDKLSYYIQTENNMGVPINVPVIDVRDGIVERMLAESILKAQNTSRWIKYNQYHVSQKQRKQI